MDEREYQPRVDLYVRSLCPVAARRCQEEVIERLRTMDEAGHISGVSVDVWGKRVPCDERATVGGSTLERIESFRAWSDRAGTSVSSFFETVEVGSMLVDEPRRSVLLPVVCLAEHYAGRLTFVTPCVEDGKTWTVSDRLDALEEWGGTRRARGTA
jgi:hypothetical protein